MLKYKTINKKIEIPVSIICDKCKKEFDLNTMEGESEIQEFLRINFTSGFTSVFGDMNHVEVDICQYCLHDMIKDFMRVVE